MRKWLKRLAIGVGVLVAVVAVLRVGFGLHVYMDGDFGLHLGWGRTSAHYDALEAQRTAQRAAPPSAAPAAPAPAAAPVTAAPAPLDTTHPSNVPPRASGSPGPVPTDAPSWTDFRGPARDGVYRQRPVAASWPAGGPRQLWKQPIGEGHASFVIARGGAFTIEPRRAREVVAAYDLKTGRELWTTG
jgi:hypothetical protein